MGLLILIQIPCHHVLANEIALNLKYRIGIKHFFNINLGIGIIKKTSFFVCIFEISSRVRCGRNLSKNTGRYVKNTNKKVVFFFSSSKINKYYFIILTIILLVHFRRPILS